VTGKKQDWEKFFEEFRRSYKLKRLVIFDLDGVIYRGGEGLPFAAEAVSGLRELGVHVRFLTNNSTRSRSSYSEKLRGLGIEAGPDDFMSSSLATRIYLQKRAPKGARVFIVGEQGIEDELKDSFEIVGEQDRRRADFVVVGYDRQFNFDKLCNAFDALQAGAELVATNRDATFPMPDGRLLPGGGTIVAALEAAWEREPYVCGKPNPLGIRVLMKYAGAAEDETLLVGDRPSSDMITGSNAGVQTCLVLTGVTSREQSKSLEGELKPNYVIDDLGSLLSLECFKKSEEKTSDDEGSPSR